MKSARLLRGISSMIATTSSVALKKQVFAYFFLRPAPWRIPCTESLKGGRVSPPYWLEPNPNYLPEVDCDC